MAVEMQIKGRGVFRFPDSVSPSQAEQLIRRDFPDTLKSAAPLPNFVEKELKQLRTHEGETRNNAGQHVSYPDSFGFLTGGIGHLMSDEEKKTYPIGTAIPDKVVDRWFKDDVATAEKGTNNIIESFALKEAPDEVKQILFNMTFNMGEKGLRSFTNTLPAISRKDYRDAANRMGKSKWFGQVKSRGVDLVSRMNSVADPLDNPPGTKFNVEVGTLEEGDFTEPTKKGETSDDV